MVKVISRILILVAAATHFSLVSAAVSCNVGSDGVAICVDGTSTITGPTVGTTGGPVACNVGFDGVTCTPVNGSPTITGATGVASASVSCSVGTDGIACGSGPTVTPPSTPPIPTASVSCSVGVDGIACQSHSSSAGEKTAGSALTFVSVGLALAAYQLF
ncbi:hypothetical protein MVEN_01085000 [Mycena venus]|uniref:Uncharacterized protein n=1 Tax=Mycena venus TaxID=2733690 RepID=A0A8H6Y7R7_9AGAR|nr:hypothetical protein MVEN_01085000 [Mycena venus]